ncbi:MAG: beta-propeller fold lactonase family protein [Tannerella sp.]|jgi:YVTN family beta-propeller protein|nr:beta-propeller fold lactonase family protein [Tannerella sp.]
MKKIPLILIFAAIVLLSAERDASPYLSPGRMAVSSDGKTVYTALTTAHAIAVTGLATGQTAEQIETKQNPNGVLLSNDGTMLYVAEGGAKGTVEFIALPRKKSKRTVRVGHTPDGLAVTKDGRTLFVANRFSDNISVIDIESGRVTATVPAVREPRYMALSPDGATLAAGNFLPAQAAIDENIASEITLIDVNTAQPVKNIALPAGSQSLTGVAFSGDGRYLYAVHILSRFYVPITQIDRGWVNTNALSIVDMKSKELYATVLLDDVERGAANPADAGIGNDGKLYVAVAGAHELMGIDLEGLHEKIAGIYGGTVTDAGVRNREEMMASLSFAYPFKKRIALNGRLPLYLAFTGKGVLISSRFSPFIETVSYQGVQNRIILGNEPEPDSYRRGELAFNDASICYQQWHSCASCHPDGRADGLNWDQQNDGLGNPKNTKSLLFSHVTPPCMITGIRESAEKAVRAGILHTLQTVQPESIAADMDEYLKKMRVQESPYLAEAPEKALKSGRKLFEQTGCALCHNGQYYTDRQKYDVGTGDGNDSGRPFDTPSLREVWRTAPYLYDGRAATLEEVFTRFNPDGRHGNTSRLTKEELEALILYIKTL